MSPAFEAVLARLYTDEAFLKDFLANPNQVAAQSLPPNEANHLAAIDPVALSEAARSFAHKRAKERGPSRPHPRSGNSNLQPQTSNGRTVCTALIALLRLALPKSPR